MIILAQNLYPVSARHYEFPIFRGFTTNVTKLVFLCTRFTVFWAKSTFFEGVITLETRDSRQCFQCHMSSESQIDILVIIQLVCVFQKTPFALWFLKYKIFEQKKVKNRPKKSCCRFGILKTSGFGPQLW